MSELAAVKKKIYNLLNMTRENGASESEAMFAMKKAGELLAQFNLSMDEVQLREEVCVTGRYVSRNKGRDSLWHSFDGIRKLCGVKVWIEGRGNWKFFGLESDVEMAKYLCDIILDAQDTELATFKHSALYAEYAGHRRTLTANFVTGFGQRINSRLIAMAQDNAKAEREAAEHLAKQATMVEASNDAYKSKGTALISVAKEQKIEEEFARVGPKLRTRTSYSGGRYNAGARFAGANAGERVNLNRPIGGGSNARAQIAG